MRNGLNPKPYRAARRVPRRPRRPPVERRKTLPVRLAGRQSRRLLFAPLRPALNRRSEKLDDSRTGLRLRRRGRRGSVQRRDALRLGRSLPPRKILPLLQYARRVFRRGGRSRLPCRTLPRRTTGARRIGHRPRGLRRRRRTSLLLLGAIRRQRGQTQGQHARNRPGDRDRFAGNGEGSLFPRRQQHAQTQRYLLHGLFPPAQGTPHLYRLLDVPFAAGSLPVRRRQRRQRRMRPRIVEQPRFDLRIRR